jgi:hypothetical protein
MKCAHKALAEKHEGKRLLRRPRHRWEDNIRTDSGKIGKLWT